MTSFGNLEENVSAARRLGDEIRKVGGWTYVPHLQSCDATTAALHSYDEWIEDDLDMLRTSCQAMALVSGWENSRGSRIEEEYARINAIPVFYPGTGQLISIRDWIEQQSRRQDPFSPESFRQTAVTLPEMNL